VNNIHDLLKGSFVELSEPERHEVAPGVAGTVEFRPGHLTGVVYGGHEDGLRATVQSRVAVIRWQKQFTKHPQEYPRFATMQAALWQVIEAVETVYELKPLPIAVVNMSYVNFLPVTDFASVLTDYFSKSVHVQATENAELIRKVELSWRNAGIDLRFCLEKLTAVIDEDSMDGCRLTTVAGVTVPEPDGDPKVKLEEVHARLQVFFRDVISDRAKKEWQLQEAPDG
jgi:uncharacterized protein (TIGR04255 family)